ncbi:hypothetical protein EQV77_06795 [Halobacillus fulvus]|nr:hypothetical protein EQV77_06795 [Halobacillus fulvus]
MESVQMVKKSLWMTALVLFFTLMFAPASAYADKCKFYEPVLIEQDYSCDFTHKLVVALKQQEKGPLSFEEANERIIQLSQAEAMDTYLGSKSKTGEVLYAVNEAFDISLKKVSDLDAGKQTDRYPDEIVEGVKKTAKYSLTEEEILLLPKVQVMDFYLKSRNDRLEGPEIRQLINTIFGINLDGISSLEGAGIGLFSKEQWIIQGEKDLFVVYTSVDDVEARIEATEYFKEQTGLDGFPDDLKRQLEEIGYTYNEAIDAYFYANPTGESVPDEFKGRTLGTLAKYIQQNYSDLLN